jgi:hypothetical protein
MTMTPAEVRSAVTQIRDALAPMRRPRGAWQAEWQRIWERFKAMQAEAEADYQARVAQWDRDRPLREAAQRAKDAADARLAAERGALPARRPVLAAWPARPERPVIW